MKNIIKMKNTPLIALFLFTFGIINAQVSTPIPLPSGIVSGKLENGMSYFIYHNQEPKDRVSFYFAQNVGAVLEEDSENGLAHFLEHMAFNGSKNFPGNSVDDFIEKKGLLFGRDLNAYTSFDETVYNIDNIITTDEEAIDKALLILNDWSGSLLLEGEDIDKERGVINEEWRQLRDPNGRVQEKMMPIIFRNSKYAKRDVIGKPEFIQSFDHKELRAYYKKWYRPDLQAVIIVGDIDVNKMEKKIKQLFSKIPMPKNVPKRPYYKVPNDTEFSYTAIKEEGLPAVNLQLLYKSDIAADRGEAYLREKIVGNIFSSILNSRLQEVTENPASSANEMQHYEYPMTLDKKLNSIYVDVKQGGILAAFEELITELTRIKTFGITDSELKREKEAIKRNFEDMVSQEKNKTNSEWAVSLGNYYLQANPLIKADKNLELLLKWLPTITKDEVSAMVHDFLNRDKSNIIVTGPNNESVSYPTKEEVLAVLDKVSEIEITGYVDEGSATPLISKELDVKPIANTFSVESIAKAKGYTLANGAKIILYPSEEKEDEININAVSLGGFSLVATEDLPSAEKVDQLVQLSGVGEFSTSQLNKKLSGKNVQVYPYIEEYNEGLLASGSVNDLETMFQLMYLYFEQPRFDKALFEAKRPNWIEEFENSKNDEQLVFSKKAGLAMSNNHPRSQPNSIERISKISFEKAVEIYKKRFANVADFTFVITGNFVEEEILLLLQKYIGNIKSNSESEKWIDHEITPKKGNTATIFEQPMANPQTTILYFMSGNMDYSIENSIFLKALSAALGKRYLKTIREEEGGSYGVYVHSEVEIHEDRFSLMVYFNCNPDLQAKLLKIVKEEIAILLEKGPNPDAIEKAKNNLLKDRKESIQKDEFWLSQLVSTQLMGEPYVDYASYEKMIKKITPEHIRAFAKKVLTNADQVEVVMNPKK